MLFVKGSSEEGKGWDGRRRVEGRQAGRQAVRSRSRSRSQAGKSQKADDE